MRGRWKCCWFCCPGAREVYFRACCSSVTKVAQRMGPQCVEGEPNHLHLAVHMDEVVGELVQMRPTAMHP